MAIDHDRLFKELLSTFFYEFLQLFLPKVAAFVQRDSLTALDKEVFTDVTLGESHEVDLLMQAQFKRQTAWFLLHVETQSYAQSDFNRRMFHYFARLSEKYGRPVYPIVLFSYDAPLRPEPDAYRVRFPNKTVLQFKYDVIQLNRLDWHNYLNKPNPVASALMSKMQIASDDRVRVKLACLRMLAGLNLNPTQEKLISGFTDIYLRLSETEDQTFQNELDALGLVERERVMEIVTSWMKTGLERGRVEGELNALLKLFKIRFGQLSPELEAKMKVASQNTLDSLIEVSDKLTTIDDLKNWLDQFGKE